MKSFTAHAKMLELEAARQPNQRQADAITKSVCACSRNRGRRQFAKMTGNSELLLAMPRIPQFQQHSTASDIGESRKRMDAQSHHTSRLTPTA